MFRHVCSFSAADQVEHLSLPFTVGMSPARTSRKYLEQPKAGTEMSFGQTLCARSASTRAGLAMADSYQSNELVEASVRLVTASVTWPSVLRKTPPDFNESLVSAEWVMFSAASTLSLSALTTSKW